MSSTRTAKDDTVYHPERHASSPDYETGLIGSMVARRCSFLKDKADRALIWWLHFMSWQPGGLKNVAETMIARYGDKFGTEQMVKIGKRSGQNYTAEEVKIIRAELPILLRHNFLLKGEMDRETKDTLRHMRGAKIDFEESCHYLNETFDTLEKMITRRQDKIDEEQEKAQSEADKHPDFYAVADFLALCREAALDEHRESQSGEKSLDKLLRDLCFNPGVPLHSDPPWFFSKWDTVLQDYMKEWVAERRAGVVVTDLGKIVHEMLDYTLHSRTMNLLEGDARTGKSFSARTWCEQHPGEARFIEVPVGNDDAGFFRAFARGLGIGNFSQYKAGEIKERVESVLLAGDIMVCLDESQRLWPEMNIRYGVPKRINWLMSMVNKRVPFCLVSTPQFLDRQTAWERNAGWNSAQFIGRLGLSQRLPGDLPIKDLMAIGSSILPEVETDTIRALAAYARKSARYLAAIDSIAARARYIAERIGRSQVTTEDVHTAMQQSIIPSDSALVRTLERAKKPAGKGRMIAPMLPAKTENEPLPAAREIRPAPSAPAGVSRRAVPVQLVQA